jgi:hypothetical protein
MTSKRRNPCQDLDKLKHIIPASLTLPKVQRCDPKVTARAKAVNTDTVSLLYRP